ncbi:hypothetical protein [Neobacillus terrae]|uniref:hypothetical protein n=1 Tax=Neobacillus terrae TaxID=3034837 RepID=UPI001407F838|nr:hypothetical protein [Neobacillus terrae]NHM31203.1 hypothetical protein [Neobacillus terrae]
MDQEDLVIKIEEIYRKISMLEKTLQEKQSPPIIVNVDIKDLHLNEVNLEELAFHLDKLDINELSGMLNLGNTFSPVVHPKKKTAKQEKTDKRNDIQVKINEKQVAYTID